MQITANSGFISGSFGKHNDFFKAWLCTEL
jgi:hypothetical protein